MIETEIEKMRLAEVECLKIKLKEAQAELAEIKVLVHFQTTRRLPTPQELKPAYSCL
jgi:hypothetical protein